MRKYSEIENADDDEWGFADPNDEKTVLIRRLIQEGHKPIAIGRAIAIVQQCDPIDGIAAPGDRVCSDPLKVTIFPDPNLDDRPVDLYVHAGKYGLDNTVMQRGDSRKVLVPIDFDAYQQLLEFTGAGVPVAILKIMEMPMLLFAAIACILVGLFMPSDDSTSF